MHHHRTIALGLGVVGSLLGAVWLFFGARAPLHSPAAEPRTQVAAGALPARPALSAQGLAGAVPSATPPLLLEATSDAEPTVDWAWEERLSLKPDDVIDFFHRPSVTFAEWARAYRADICACDSFECVTALQDDFVSRAPPFTDMRQDEETGVEIRAAITCADRHAPSPVVAASLATDEGAARRHP